VVWYSIDLRKEGVERLCTLFDIQPYYVKKDSYFLHKVYYGERKESPDILDAIMSFDEENIVTFTSRFQRLPVNVREDIIQKFNNIEELKGVQWNQEPWPLE